MTQVVILDTTREYISGTAARYGENGKCNDARIWNEIIAEAKEDLKKNSNAQNILTFFEKNLDSIVTERGFRDSEGDGSRMLAPQSTPKGEKQQTQEAADFSSFVTNRGCFVEQVIQSKRKDKELRQLVHRY